MRAFFKKLWPWGQPAVTDPVLTVKFNKENKEVRILLDWPTGYPENILTNQVCSMLIELQTGSYNRTICESLAKTCELKGDVGLAEKMLDSLNKKADNLQVAAANFDEQSMWPTQTFKQENRQ